MRISDWSSDVCSSDLSADERDECARLLVAVEGSLIAATRPTKMNLATLGNVVPHLHWHVVASYTWDSRFPDAIWAPPRRQVHPSPAENIRITTEALASLVAEAVRMSKEHDRKIPRLNSIP